MRARTFAHYHEPPRSPCAVNRTRLAVALLFFASLVLPSAASARASGDELRLGAALDSVSAKEIASDLYFFASDEMKGRDTPSREQRVAARFVRARLERLGFTPGAGSSFLYEYPLRARRIDPETSHITVRGPSGERELHFTVDYFVPSSGDLVAYEVEGPLVWCGDGEREDFEAVTLVRKKGEAGKEEEERSWAVCRFSDLSARRRAKNAEAAGAAGLIVLPDPAGTDDPAKSECARATDYALRGLNSYSPRDSQPQHVLPQVFLTRAAAGALLASLGLERLPEKPQVLPGTLREVRSGSGTIQAEDVCALWPGSDPELAKEVILVSAHYDHDGVKNGVIYPGADDNGSGSMGLLALAEALVEYGPMRRSVMLIWMSGEEKGLWGSAAWTTAPSLPAGHKAVCDVNIDMIGRNAPDYLLITPTRARKEYNGLARLAESLAPLEGFPRLGSADEYWERSDHHNFSVNLKIPVAFLFSGEHADYHKPTDTPDKIDYDKIRRVVRLVMRLLDGLQGDELPS